MTASRYNPAVTEIFLAPAGLGDAGPASAGWVRGEAGSATRGVWISFGVQVQEGRIQRVVFRVQGCPHTIAACSLAARMLQNQPARTLAGYDIDPLLTRLEIPVEKLARLLVLQDALQMCFDDWENRRLEH